MKFYIAAQNQNTAKEVAKILSEAGHEVTARWINKEFNRTVKTPVNERKQIATDDYHDVVRSDALVLCAAPLRASGGKFVEAGIAIGMLKPVYVLGHIENILLYHWVCKQFNNVEDLIEYLQSNNTRPDRGMGE